MNLAAGIPAITLAALPILGWRMATVSLAALGVFGVLIAVLGHLAHRDRRGEAWRQVRFLGLVLAPTALARALVEGWQVAPRPLLSAAFSLLDLTLLAQALLAGMAVLSLGRAGRSTRAMLLLPAVLAIFLGLVGGEFDRPLLARNAPAALGHVLLYAVLTLVLLRELVRELTGSRDEAREHAESLTAERDVLRGELSAVRDERDETLVRAEQAVEISRGASRRARLLEHLLASAVELHGLRGVPDLFTSAVQLVSQLFAFGRVELHQWSDTDDRFVVRAVVEDGALQDDLRGSGATERADYEQMVHPRFRVSNSYLVPASAASLAPAGAAASAAWPDGQQLVVPLADPAGALHGYIALSAPADHQAPDLLQIRYLELFARQLAAVLEGGELRDRLASCRDELVVATDRLQSLGDLRSNFIANVSHELRTPLTSIIGYSEMLRDRGDSMSPDVRREFLSVIHEQGQQFREIIENLLDLERMEDQTTRVERAECDLATLTRRLAEDWRQQAERKDLELQVDCPDDRLLLEADPVLCQQLLEHLLDNAIKFTAPGGSVTARVFEQGTAARIEVQDTGIGIPEDKLHTIFEQFYQVDGSSTREVGGQGVGLSICRDIVSWHDGRIWAENIPGGGTCLTVILPRRPHVVLPSPPPTINPVFHDPRLSLQRLLHWVSENLGVHSAVLLRTDQHRDHLEVIAAAGIPAGQLQDLRLGRGVGPIGRTWSDGESRIETPESGDVLLADGGPVLCVPLIDEGVVAGVIAVRDRHDGRPFRADDRLLLEAMAPRLVHLLQRYEGQEGSLRDFAAIQSSLRATTRVGTLPHTDVASVCHEICLASARRLGLSDPELRHLAFALRYYDVGLSTVPPHLLNKADALTDAERVQLERHVQAGLVTLAPIKPPPKVREIILHHHENFDGSGYPEGLAGEAIPLGSRLIALTDSLRALLQRRPWRPAVPLSDALAEIQAFAGTRYCPRLTAVFLEEAEKRRRLIEELREHADDGEDLRRPASAHPVQTIRP
jgi:signal transduction histidine kinase/GAF domain-containing protein